MGRPRTPIEIRFWKYVSIPKNPEDCWEWQGSRIHSGYGRTSIFAPDKQAVSAHRVSYMLHYGVIPDGLWVLHSCHNPPCVNPTHLHLGTHSQNMKEMWARGRQAGFFWLKASKLDKNKALLIIALHEKGVSTKAIAQMFQVDRKSIWNVVNKRTWAKR